MEFLGTYTAPYWDSVRSRAAEHLAHFSFEFFASVREKPRFSRDVNEGGAVQGGKLLGDNEGCVVADGEEWR